MGLLGLILAYRTGRRRAARRATQRFDLDRELMQEVCDNCGYERIQHDDNGRCPTYDPTATDSN